MILKRIHLKDRAQQFTTLVTRIQRENQLHLTQHHLGIIGGTTLALLSLFQPTIALMLGAAAYKGLQQGGALLENGPERISAAKNMGFAAAGGAIAGVAIGAVPLIGPPLAVAAAGLLGGGVGKAALPEIANAAEDKVLGSIEKFFDSVHQFLAKGRIYKPLAKIAMQQTIESFTPIE